MRKDVYAGALIALIVLGLLLVGALVMKLAALVLLVLIALVVTNGIAPLVERLEQVKIRGWALPRPLATVLIIVVAVLVLLGIVALFAVVVIKETATFSANVWPTLQSRLTFWLGQMAARYPIVPDPAVIFARLSAQSGQIAGYVISTTRAVFGFIGGLFSLMFVLILTVFFTSFKDGITYTLLQFVPPRYHDRVQHIAHLAAEKMGGWLRGQVTLALIITLSTVVGMSVLQVRYAAMIGIIAGIGELIPMVGPYLAFVPAIIIVLATGAQLWQLILVVLFFIALSQVENFILAPKVMERHVELSPVTTILALLVGGSLLGIVGALLAIPLAAAGRVILLEAVFPAIQGKTRREIEDGRPGAHQEMTEQPAEP